MSQRSYSLGISFQLLLIICAFSFINSSAVAQPAGWPAWAPWPVTATYNLSNAAASGCPTSMQSVTFSSNVQINQNSGTILNFSETINGYYYEIQALKNGYVNFRVYKGAKPNTSCNVFGLVNLGTFPSPVNFGAVNTSSSGSNWNCSTCGVPTVTTPITCSAAASNPSCFGESSGSATVQVAGGSGNYTYSWSGGSQTSGTSSTLNGLAPGNYTVSVTNGSESTTCSVTITGSAEIKIFVRPTDNSSISSRPSGNDGFMSLILGATPSVTYSWTGPSTSAAADPTGIKPGRYMLQVRDGNDCEETAGPFFLR
ncbi:MAG: SprB repeat-containing protein [Flavobacteriales bacterium]|nr:SprB repeat-containing protein [Flavobacteriales bacterium]